MIFPLEDTCALLHVTDGETTHSTAVGAEECLCGSVCRADGATVAPPQGFRLSLVRNRACGRAETGTLPSFRDEIA